MMKLSFTSLSGRAVFGVSAFFLTICGAIAGPDQDDEAGNDYESGVEIVEEDGKKTLIIEMRGVREDVERIAEEARALAEDMHGQALSHLDRSMALLDENLAALTDLDVDVMADLDGLEFDIFIDDEDRHIIVRPHAFADGDRIKTDDDTDWRSMTDEEKEAFEAKYKEIRKKVEQELKKAEHYRRQALAQAEEGLKIAKEHLQARQRELALELERRKTDQ